MVSERPAEELGDEGCGAQAPWISASDTAVAKPTMDRIPGTRPRLPRNTAPLIITPPHPCPTDLARCPALRPTISHAPPLLQIGHGRMKALERRKHPKIAAGTRLIACVADGAHAKHRA